MSTDKNIIKNWFKTGLKPTQGQFWSTWDSFWHKDEKLPISNVENLENILNNKAENNHNHAEYATNDASSLSEENIINWQAKLGIEDLEMTDESVKITEDYPEFGLDNGNSIKSFNSTVYSMLSSDNLGSNFANTDLEVNEDRKHTGEATVDFGMPLIFSNPSQRFSGLQDKSDDENYNAFQVTDEQGNLARATQIANLFEKTLQGTTSEQGLRIGQLLGGGTGDAGAISVNTISPYVIQNRFDSVEYVLLRGANLKLSTIRKIEILDKISTEVVATIPNDQVISESSTELIFYFNFYQFSEGTYVLRLTSGGKVYTTSQEFKILNQIENININAIQWEWVYADGVTPSINDIASGGDFTIETPQGASPIPKVNLKSSELFAEGEDFYIEIQLDFSRKASDADWNTSRIGLGYSDTELSTNQDSLVYFTYSFFQDSRIVTNGTFQTPYSVNVIITKTGNLFKITYNDYIEIKTLSNNSGYSIFTQILGRGFHFNDNQIIQGKILKAFKFN
ncbi:hypothetical protein SAMN05443634_10496 [Chishuiella changwenlii]|uniref:Uncharacterized protein n=1 Tax=Chishuiella changwenlii TaxID=1434701 RepID=A0A1M6VZJ4_9FLAO|nr:hypothetical protein [Chishuiella changwenlii]GGE89512.1 hypothetical protein GCM10010984_03950 [Chishuiella changwenlii]SHK86735.1 hypothetical protein SAMN05443634_10496 [Chishuiella changwenlii]